MRPNKLILLMIATALLSWIAREVSWLKSRHTMLEEHLVRQHAETTAQLAQLNEQEIKEIIRLTKPEPLNYPINQAATGLLQSVKPKSDQADRSLPVSNALWANQLSLFDSICSLQHAREVRNKEHFDHFIPVFHLQQKCVRRGKPVEAELYFTSYTTDSHLSMTAFGKEIRIENGIGRFEKVFSTPGQKQIPILVNYLTPWDTAYSYLQRTFIIDLCR